MVTKTLDSNVVYQCIVVLYILGFFCVNFFPMCKRGLRFNPSVFCISINKEVGGCRVGELTNPAHCRPRLIVFEERMNLAHSAL